MSQVQLAEKIGVKKQSISNWENDNIMPSVEMLIKLAEFFQVSTDYLLGREDINASVQTIDVTGLTKKQRDLFVMLVDELRDR